MGVHPFRAPFQAGFERFHAAVIVVALQARYPSRNQASSHSGYFLTSREVQAFRILHFAAPFGHQGQVPDGDGKIGRQLQRALMFLARSRQIALLLQDRTEVGVRRARIRPELYGLGIGFGGLVGPPQLLRSNTRSNQPSKEFGALSTSFAQCLAAASKSFFEKARVASPSSAAGEFGRSLASRSENSLITALSLRAIPAATRLPSSSSEFGLRASSLR